MTNKEIKIVNKIEEDQMIYRSFKENNLFGETGLFSQECLYLPNFASQEDRQEGKGTVGNKEYLSNKDLIDGVPRQGSIIANSFSNLLADNQFFASCWCMDRNIALNNTQMYQGAIIIVSRVNRLLDSLIFSQKFKSLKLKSLEFGRVRYLDNNSVVPNNDSSLPMMFNELAFIKRREYEWENEVRLVATMLLDNGLLSESIENQPNAINLDVKIKTLVEEIIICREDISSEVRCQIHKIANQYGIKMTSKGY